MPTLDSLLALYREPLFWQFPIATIVIGMIAFMAFALPMTWAAQTDVGWLRLYRIQNRREKPGLFWPSVWAWLRNNLWMLAVVVLVWPLVRLSGVHAGPLPTWWLVALQLLFFIYLDDAIYYAFHRTMHRPWWFKRVHGVHHRVHTPWAITGHNMHPFEYVATGLIATLGPVLVGAHVFTVYLWVVIRQWEAAEGHCGYDLPFSPTRFLPLSDGALHHDFHHARVRGNFGGFLPIWDRMFGTYVRDYEADRDRLRTAQHQPTAGA